MTNSERVSVPLTAPQPEIVAYCPNCGIRYSWPELIEDVRTEPESHRCGDCAQAGVRPRELYVLRLTDANRDSGPAVSSTSTPPTREEVEKLVAARLMVDECILPNTYGNAAVDELIRAGWLRVSEEAKD